MKTNWKRSSLMNITQNFEVDWPLCDSLLTRRQRINYAHPPFTCEVSKKPIRLSCTFADDRFSEGRRRDANTLHSNSLLLCLPLTIDMAIPYVCFAAETLPLLLPSVCKYLLRNITILTEPNFLYRRNQHVDRGNS